MKIDKYWTNFPEVSHELHILIAFLYFLIGLLAFIFNAIVLFYLIKVKSVKRAGTYFLINLAVADLLKAIFSFPMNVISSYHGKWMFDQIGCDTYGVLGGIFGFSSITTMFFMTLERYIIIKNPLFALKTSKDIVYGCIIFIWFYSTICILPQLFVNNGFVLEGLLTSCSFDYISTDQKTRILMMAMFIGGFIFPLFLIIIFYILIWQMLRSNEIFRNCDGKKTLMKDQNQQCVMYTKCKETSRFQRNTKNIKIECKLAPKKNSNENNCEVNSHSKQNLLNEKTCVFVGAQKSLNNSFVKKEVKLVKTIILIVAMFCVAWLPYAVIVLFAQFGANRLSYITPFTTSLPSLFAKTSSIYNPILYTLTNKDCKKYFRRVFFQKCGFFCCKKKKTTNVTIERSS